MSMYRSDKSVSPSNSSIELRRNSEIDELHLGVVSQQDVLAFDIAMDDFIAVQIAETAQDLSADVGDPLFFETLALRWLDEIGDWAGTAILHDQPQLIVLARRRLLYERAVVCGDVAVVRILLQHVDLQLDLFLLVFGDIHDFDGRELAGLRVSALQTQRFVICISLARTTCKRERERRKKPATNLVNLSVSSISNDFDQLEDASWLLENAKLRQSDNKCLFFVVSARRGSLELRALSVCMFREDFFFVF